MRFDADSEPAERTKADLDSLGLFASALGHVGDGNFHTSIMYDKRDPEQQRKVEKCVHDMVDRALELEGTCTVGVVNKATTVTA